MKRDFKVTAEVIEGSHGIFDVTVDGKLVFSKDKIGRFPNPGEVSAILKGT